MGTMAARLAVASALLMLHAALLAASSTVAVDTNLKQYSNTARYFPSGPILLAYPSGGECDHKVITAVQQGLNVVIWSFINLGRDANGKPEILLDQAPNCGCVANTWTALQKMGLNATFMISIGGWGSPHPTILNDDAAVYLNWKTWNEEICAQSGWPGFDGVDWDLEGVNDLSSSENHFPVAMLDLVGRFSQVAKSDGYFVSLVPPESYFDVEYNAFNRDLTNNYPDFMPSFHYHGRNSYAYIVSKYDTLNLPKGQHLFDFVTVQLYESYAHVLYNTSILKQPVAEYLFNYIPKLYNGWEVDFSSDPTLNWTTQMVSLQQTQTVLGLANGWADPTRCFISHPTNYAEAHMKLEAQGLAPRGYGFWTILNEGDTPQGWAKPLYLAAELNKFLHVRS